MNVAGIVWYAGMSHSEMLEYYDHTVETVRNKAPSDIWYEYSYA